MNPNCNFIQVSTFNGVSAGGGSGSGDVVGPASAVSGNIATFDGTTGKLIEDSGVAILNVLLASDIGVTVQAHGTKLDTFQALADGTTGQVLSTNGAGVYSWITPAGGGDVVGPASATDSVVAVFDGTTGKLLKNSTVAVADILVTGDIGTSVQAHGTKLDTFQALADGATGQLLSTNGAGVYSWVTSNGLPTGTTDGAILSWDSGTSDWVEIVNNISTNDEFIYKVNNVNLSNAVRVYKRTSDNYQSILLHNQIASIDSLSYGKGVVIGTTTDTTGTESIPKLTLISTTLGGEIHVRTTNASTIGSIGIEVNSSNTRIDMIAGDPYIRMTSASSGFNVRMYAPLTADSIFRLPSGNGTSGQFLMTDGSGVTSWSTPAGSGDVVGPASATDSVVAVYDGITGKLLKNSTVAVADILVTGDIGTSVQAHGTKLDTFQALADGTTGQVLSTNGAGVYSWITPAGSGDVVGPASATDSVVAVFDGTTGKLLKNSTVAVADILVTGDIGTSVQAHGTKLDTFQALADGTTGQVLSTNGAGVYSWITPSGSGNVSSALDFTTNDRLVLVDFSTGAKNVKQSSILASNILLASNNLSDIPSPASARVSLELVPGIDVQTQDATLSSISTAGMVLGSLIIGTGANAVAQLTIGTTGQVLTSNGTTALWSTPSGTAFTWTTGTQASSNVDITDKHIVVTLSSGTAFSLDTLIDETTIGAVQEHKIKIINSSGSTNSITTAEDNNFGGSYPMFTGTNSTFLVWKDGSGVVQYGNAGEYA